MAHDPTTRANMLLLLLRDCGTPPFVLSFVATYLPSRRVTAVVRVQSLWRAWAPRNWWALFTMLRPYQWSIAKPVMRAWLRRPRGPLGYLLSMNFRVRIGRFPSECVGTPSFYYDRGTVQYAKDGWTVLCVKPGYRPIDLWQTHERWSFSDWFPYA